MRIEHLSIEGFGPFAERQDVDFAALDEAGLFLITGRTGSGKSSILDAICFALYGRAPRYDGGELRVRSDHVAPEVPTRVELVFRAGGERWRVVRSPEYDRPKRRGEGTTVQKEEAALHRWSDDGWQGVAARAVDVGEHLTAVLQLSREQFLQVILLAQGRFQQFLRARSEDRVALLRALFGTERFDRFERELADRAKALNESVGAASRAIDADLERLARLCETVAPDGADADWADGVAAAARAAAQSAQRQEAAAEGAYATADAAATAATALAGLQERRSRARAALTELDAGRDEIDAAKRRRAAAVRVLPVMPAIERSDRAAAARADAERALTAARAAAGPVADDALAEVERMDAALGALDAPLREERQLAELEAMVTRSASARDERSTVLSALEERTGALPVRRAAHEAKRREAAALAARLLEFEADVARERDVARSAAAVATLQAAATAAATSLLNALDREHEAGARVRLLVAERHAGAAASLAALLRDGEPCAVCGAVEHPAPAVYDVEPPADDVLDAAQAAQDRAVRDREAATDTDATARADLAAALVASRGRSPAEAAAVVAEAEAALGTARRAADALTEATGALQLLDGEEARLASELAAARSALADADQALTRHREGFDQSAGRVARARGGAASVEAVAVGLRDRRRRLAALADAVAAANRADALAAEADAEAARALAEAGIADTTAARAAAMPTSEREALDRRIAAADDRRAAATAQLTDPAVASAQEEPADVEGTKTVKAAALDARILAGDLRGSAVLRAGQATDLAAGIRTRSADIGHDRETLAVLGPLASVVRGEGANDRRMRLESYVLAARLEEIVRAANTRLAVMTDGRFTLRHDDSVGYRNVRSGLGLEVLDEHTGRGRPIASLSGGETFLASLALALGLAEVVTQEAGGVRLDTLFVDEGFGSLDGETLETAMTTLDSLRAGGRVVGLISHVDTMQEDIPAGLHVERMPSGSSRIRQRVLTAR